MLSANMVAQKPGDRAIPPLSPLHAAAVVALAVGGAAKAVPAAADKQASADRDAMADWGAVAGTEAMADGEVLAGRHVT
jgi:hypothetical protein